MPGREQMVRYKQVPRFYVKNAELVCPLDSHNVHQAFGHRVDTCPTPSQRVHPFEALLATIALRLSDNDRIVQGDHEQDTRISYGLLGHNENK